MVFQQQQFFQIQSATSSSVFQASSFLIFLDSAIYQLFYPRSRFEEFSKSRLQTSLPEIDLIFLPLGFIKLVHLTTES